MSERYTRGGRRLTIGEKLRQTEAKSDTKAKSDVGDDDLLKRLREPKRWEYWNGYALTFESNAPFDAADEIVRLRKDLARMSNLYLEAIGALKEARPLFHDCDATAIRMDRVTNGDSHE